MLKRLWQRHLHNRDRLGVETLVLIAVILAFFFILASCGGVERGTPLTVKSEGGTWSSSNFEVINIEGMNCIFYDAYEASALTCNWDKWGSE